MQAACQCGQLRVNLPGPLPVTAAYHRIACQRCSGSPFAVLSYCCAEQVGIDGDATAFERATDDGDRFMTYFCSACGSTVCVLASKHPGLIEVPVGAIADPSFLAPVPSVWEDARHGRVTLPDGLQRFPRGPG